jgi:hypothetical protein
MRIKGAAAWIVFAGIGCTSVDQGAMISGPANVEPSQLESNCSAPECSMYPSISPDGVTATVWWSARTLNGKATMAFFGNYGRVDITADGGGQTADGFYERYQTVLPYPQYYEATAQKLTNTTCGQTATGTGTFAAEIRLISSGLQLHRESASLDAMPAPQPRCLNQNGGSLGGGDASPAVNYIPYTCYYVNYYENDVLVSSVDLGCEIG